MGKIQFEERAVAFIDVLGFKDLVKKAANNSCELKKLQELFDLLSSAIPKLDNDVHESVPKDLIPKHIFISDSIILTAPLEHKATLHGSVYNGLEIVVMRCIQLTYRFLELGYLLRGGIEIGQVWHDESNIIGPAYQEAYKLEAIIASVPRIILGESATRHWEQTFKSRNRLCIERDGACMVNGLHDAYMYGVEENISIKEIIDKYEEYIEIVEEKINSDIGAKEKAKWHWFLAWLKYEQTLPPN